MKVIEYRMLSPDDPCDNRYRAWSRIYEYPLFLRSIKELGLEQGSVLHNTSCGSEPIHRMFSSELGRLPFEVVCSDIFRRVDVPNYVRYDITTPWPQQNAFDVVINISTIEHLPKNRRLPAIKNLIRQTRVGGHILLTFDWPRVCNGEIESFVGAKMKDVRVRLNGSNSVCPDKRYCGLNIIFLHLEK